MRETHIIGDDYRCLGTGREEARVLAEFGISHVGVAYCGRGYCVIRRRPDFDHVALCFEGASEVLVGRRWHTLAAGTLYLCPAGRQQGQRAHAGQRWAFLWISFRRDCPSPCAVRLTQVDRLRVRPGAAVAAALELCRVSGGGRPLSSGLRRACAALLSAWLEETLLGVRQRDERLQRLWHEVALAPARPWTVREMARVACVSTEQLRRLCLKQYGRSPSRHLRHVRMEKACSLLRMTRMKLEAVAAHVGYADAFGFSSAFKRAVGISPRKYRTRHA